MMVEMRGILVNFSFVNIFLDFDEMFFGIYVIEIVFMWLFGFCVLVKNL